MTHKLITGNRHTDSRGNLTFNNDFDASPIKRLYTIENKTTDYIRAWQGHKIESRWFSAIKGSFEIKLIQIDNWENPNKNAEICSTTLNDKSLDTLCVPKGYINSIQALEENSKLLVMSDYGFDEIKDEYRFDPNYFTL
ncbi:sugar epimerase [Bizionia gelidisalsuginis]|uniref:Sugar epimerase n=1 Tax=Bizionia gelidisalsuginis TaxID=291188 RepID=A0ABY3M7C9_9FLAO|nr:WxcM-like domain-containing protein [Bizionia gelidisalsuginis]TYC08809.1 sugar epimerase [Bizionia gelidisalsuginis]